MYVIGTAGHVDHGKSTLVRRLTGIDPDRLAEEKRREMTIDLGFAWFDLPEGERVGVVDVPGHRDFIENMLAGVAGIDAVLLVIAADEGIMPQTREHLGILDLLDVRSGLIVLSKVDLIDDPEWLALVEAEIRTTLNATALAHAPLLPVSAHTGAGIEVLHQHIATLLADLPTQIDSNLPRLSIDRIFSMSGFGTIVTGTLIGGKLRLGDEVEILPGRIRTRVRGLQTYQTAVEIAYPGSRVAVNLVGVEKAALRRGDLLTHPGQMTPTLLVDVRYRHLKDASRPLKHNDAVKLFIGAAETTAHVRLLDRDHLLPGETGWLQLRLNAPLTLGQGDRFILRQPSPPETIGGGIVVDPLPARRWKRFQPAVIDALQIQMEGSPAQRVAQAASDSEPIKRAALQKRVAMSDTELDEAIRSAIAQNHLLELPDGTYLSVISFQQTLNRLLALLDAFHEANPLRTGMPREELRSRAGIKGHTLDRLLSLQADIQSVGSLVRRAGHVVVFSAEQQTRIEALLAQFDTQPYTPPSHAESAAIVGEDVLGALVEQGLLTLVSEDVLFSRAAYETMVQTALDMIDAHGELSTAAFRDRFNTSRKYAIALLEHLDQIGITRRKGDARIRK